MQVVRHGRTRAPALRRPCLAASRKMAGSALALPLKGLERNETVTVVRGGLEGDPVTAMRRQE